MKKALSILGDGSILTRQVVHLASLLGYEFITVFGNEIPIAGDIEIVFRPAESAEEESHEDLFVAHVDSQNRAELINRWSRSNLVNLIHPRAIVSQTAILGRNIFVDANSIIGMDAKLADGVVQNSMSSIEHDNVIGCCAFLGTGAILCGYVTVNDFAFVGGGATLKPGVTVGTGVTLGTGAVLVSDAIEAGVYVGNPAKKMANHK